MTTVRAALADAARALAGREGDGARRVARRLLGHVAGLAPERLLLDSDRTLDAATEACFVRLVARRAAGEPVSRILGRREFWSLDLILGPETLDPRPDTETVVEAALAAAPARDDLRVLDLGTGSGCILLALLAERPAAFGIGVDASAGAATVARANAARLGFADRAAFLVGDWAEAIAGRFDVVVSNPPYVRSAEIASLELEVRAHDPLAALDGGADGLDAYRRIVAALDRLLAADGIAALEIGWDQAAAVAALADAHDLAPRSLVPDLAGRDRCVVLARKAVKAGKSGEKGVAPLRTRGYIPGP